LSRFYIKYATGSRKINLLVIRVKFIIVESMKRILSLVILVLVISPLNPVANAASSKYLGCDASDVACFEKYIDGKIAKNKIPEVLLIFKGIAENTNGVQGQCNNLGRYIGKKLYIKYGEEVLKYHDNVCGAPYTYGFMQEMGAKKSSPALTKKLINYCLADPNVSGCAYGVGISQSSSESKGAIIQQICEKAFPRAAKESKQPYEVTAAGICLLGWVSGRSSVLPTTFFSTINSSATLCNGIKGDASLSCLAEATFTYTYIGNPNSVERLARVNDLRGRCETDKSTMCIRFVGKALDDYFLYSSRPDISKPTDAKIVRDLVSKLCTGNKANYCIEGLITAHTVHTSKDASTKLCNILAVSSKKLCLAALR
jgi:hypothetical protein